MIRQAFILAGGFGTRLGPLTQETPKPLLKVSGIPFLEYLLIELKRFGVNRFVISTGYLAQKIHNALGNGSRLGVQITYNQENTPLGTGGALKLASHLLDNEFLVLNGDSLAELDYTQFAHFQNTNEYGFAVRRVPDVTRYGLVEVENDRVVSFAEKSATGEGYINAGVYFLNRRVLDLFPEGKSSLEEDIFPKLILTNKVGAVFCGDFFIDIGSPESYAEAQTLVPNYFCKKAVFLDRDGVLNRDDDGYFHEINKFQWIDGAPEAIKLLNKHNYYVFCVTNQSGIGRGYYSEADYFALREHMNSLLFDKGAHIDKFYHCPHTPQDKCACRKPATGLLDQAFTEWTINRDGSFLIGDKASDIGAATKSQIPAYLFTQGSLLTFVKEVLGYERNSDPDR